MSAIAFWMLEAAIPLPVHIGTFKALMLSVRSRHKAGKFGNLIGAKIRSAATSAVTRRHECRCFLQPHGTLAIRREQFMRLVD